MKELKLNICHSLHDIYVYELTARQIENASCPITIINFSNHNAKMKTFFTPKTLEQFHTFGSLFV